MARVRGVENSLLSDAVSWADAEGLHGFPVITSIPLRALVTLQPAFGDVSLRIRKVIFRHVDWQLRDNDDCIASHKISIDYSN
jgi:hypothetical protein